MMSIFIRALPFMQTVLVFSSALTAYDTFAKTPPSENIRVGGRLTSRQIESIAEGGYKTIISVFNFTTDDSSYNSVDDIYPSSNNEVLIGESYGLIVSVINSQLTPEYSTLISLLISESPKPIYIHCHVGFTASLFTLLHLYTSGAITATNIYSEGVNLGWNFQSNANAVQLIYEVTGLSVGVISPYLELPLTNNETSYKYYYWSHRVGNDNWYSQGQPLENHVDSIYDSGYKTIVSFRANGEATTRLASDNSTGPVENLEFSDENGNYCIEMERQAFESAGISFVNIPVTGNAEWTLEAFQAALPLLESIDKSGVPVLCHCKSGYRSAAYVAAYLGYIQNQCTDWALRQSAHIGFDFSENENDVAVVTFFRQVLQC